MIHPIPPLMGRSLLTGFQNLDRGLVGLQVPPDLGVGEQMLPFDSLVLLPSWAMLYRDKYSRTYKGCQPLLSYLGLNESAHRVMCSFPFYKHPLPIRQLRYFPLATLWNYSAYSALQNQSWLRSENLAVSRSLSRLNTVLCLASLFFAVNFKVI